MCVTPSLGVRRSSSPALACCAARLVSCRDHGSAFSWPRHRWPLLRQPRWRHQVVAALLVRLAPLSGAGSRHRGEIETVAGKRLRNGIGQRAETPPADAVELALTPCRVLLPPWGEQQDSLTAVTTAMTCTDVQPRSIRCCSNRSRELLLALTYSVSRLERKP